MVLMGLGMEQNHLVKVSEVAKFQHFCQSILDILYYTNPELISR